MRVPKKNIRPFMGMPMLSYPIETAQRSGLFDLIAVSTDCEEIAAMAFFCDAVVVPRAYDDGMTGTQEIAARVLEQLGIKTGEACVIYPCSPLLQAGDLVRARLTLHSTEPSNFAMSVGPDHKDAGCFYYGWVEAFRERRPLDGGEVWEVPMPAERCIDINTPEDWSRAEQMYDALRRAT